MNPTNFSDDDIAKLEASEPTTLSDNDISKMEATAGNMPHPENIFKKVLKLNEQASGGMREFVRSAGNFQNPFEGFIRGAQNPEQSETFQKQLERHADEFSGTSTLGNYEMRNAASLGGMAADAVTNPLQTIAFGLGEPAAKVVGKIPLPFGQNVGNVASKVANADLLFPLKAIGKGVIKTPGYLRNVFKSPAMIKNLETEIAGHQDFIKSSLGSLREEARNAVMSGKTTIQDIATENSTTYRNILNQMDEDLASSGRQVTNKEFAEQVVKPALTEINSLGLPGGAAKERVASMLSELSPPPIEASTDLLGMPKAVSEAEPKSLSLNDVKNLKNSVYEAMTSSSQAGTQQHLAKDVSADIFQKHYQNFVKNRLSDFYDLQTEYGPQIESQRFGFNKFEPFETSVNKGVNVLTKAAKAKYGLATPNLDEESMLSQLEKGTERFSGTGSLRGKTEDISKNIFGAKESVNKLESRLDYAKQLRTVRDDIIKWGITAMLGGTSYALARGFGNVLAHSSD